MNIVYIYAKLMIIVCTRGFLLEERRFSDLLHIPISSIFSIETM